MTIEELERTIQTLLTNYQLYNPGLIGYNNCYRTINTEEELLEMLERLKQPLQETIDDYYRTLG